MEAGQVGEALQQKWLSDLAARQRSGGVFVEAADERVAIRVPFPPARCSRQNSNVSTLSALNAQLSSSGPLFAITPFDFLLNAAQAASARLPLRPVESSVAASCCQSLRSPPVRAAHPLLTRAPWLLTRRAALLPPFSPFPSLWLAPSKRRVRARMVASLQRPLGQTHPSLTRLQHSL